MKKSLRKSVATLIALMLIFSQFAITFANETNESLIEKQNQEISESEKAIVSRNRESNKAGIVPGKVLVKYKNDTSGKISPFTTMDNSLLNQNTDSIETITLEKGKDIFEAVEELRKNPNIEYAEPVYTVKAFGISKNYNKKHNKTAVQSQDSTNNEYYDTAYQWGLSAINIEDAWEKSSIKDRNDIVIAVLDTGVDLDHPDLSANIVSGYDFINNDNLPDDDNGHGTHVAGIAAAISNNGEGIAGVASGAKIMPIKVLDNNGEGDISTIVEGIYWAVDNGADIINLSLGHSRYNYIEASDLFVDTYSQIEMDAIEYARNHGVIIIAASGNESNHWAVEDGVKNLDGDADTKSYEMPVCYPAAYEKVIGVGAVDWYPETGFIIADFSNVGEEVDVMAPGVSIASTIPIELDTPVYHSYIDEDQDGYTWEDGTSMAAPFVSGLAALIMAANDDLEEPYEVEAIIEGSTYDIADSKGHSGKDNYYGNGLIDGNYAFNTPRLDADFGVIKYNWLIDLETRDFDGTIIEDVYGDVQLFSEKYVYSNKKGKWIWQTEDDIASVFEVVYGESEIISPLPTETGKYRLYVDDKEGNNDFIKSKYKYKEIMKIGSPMANVLPGEYDDRQSIMLSVGNEPDALIYYTLDGSDPKTSLELNSWYDKPLSTNKSVKLYEKPIELDSSTTIRGVAYKNRIFSYGSTLKYTINISSGDGGGGGGDLPSDEEGETIEKETGTVTLVEDEEGKKEARVEVDEDKVKDILKDKAKESAVIDGKTGEEADKVEVEMNTDIISTANENSKSLVVETDKVSFKIEPGTIEVDESSDKISLSTTQLSYEEVKNELPKTEGEADAVSLVYDFNLSVGEKKVTNFNKPMTITIDIDMTKIKDKDKVGVYYFNETDNQWEYVGGKVEEGKITFTVEHFSTYTAMEYNKTFEDIRNHWAKEEIEKMASRHIAKGIAEDRFAPDESITRAEFAALIIRALEIKENSDRVEFKDIDEDAWYKEVVSKAYEAGIVSGTEDRRFAPNDTITREQMATMIMRSYEYASGTKLGDIITTMEIRFNDEGTASSWARRNIILANAKGIMGGFPDGSFRPKANATRAQAIVVVKKLLVELDLILE